MAPSAARGNQVSLGGIFATPPPVLSGDQYAQLLRDAWGLTVGSVRPLPSERDLNVLVDDRYVLKVANPAEDSDVLDMENAAMAHVRQVSPDLPVPALLPATSGAAVAAVTDAGGRRCLARLISRH